MIEASIDVDRYELVVTDDAGLAHASVLCDKTSEAAYLVAMCDFFEIIDDAVATNKPGYLKRPDRQWPVDQEKKGPITCLRCIGA